MDGGEITKLELKQVFKAKPELKTKLLADKETELYKKFNDDNVPDSVTIALNNQQEAAIQEHENQVIEDWATSKKNK